MGNEIEEATTHSPSVNVEEVKPLSRKLKLLTAGAIFYGNVAFGCAFNTYGPVATTMQNKYDTDDETISRVFTILTGCYMFGALSGGIIYNFINRQFAALTLLSIMGAIMLLTPHCPNMTLFFLSAAVMGFCCGSYDTAQFVWMMEMMQKDCPPYVQSQHFFYALGTSVASLIMAPFLDEDEDETTTTTVASLLYKSDYNISSDSLISADETSTKPSTKSDKLFIPYTIIGCMILVGVAYQIFLFIFFRFHKPPPEETEDSTEALQSKPEKTGETEISNRLLDRIWSLPKLRMVVLTCMFYGAYQGMEMTTFQFFPKFGQNSDLALSESESTYVLTGMTVSFAVGRAIAIIAVFRISTQLILCGNIALVIIANILLAAWASNSLPTLWASSILFGLGFSSIYASISAFIERHLVFTNFMVGLMIVCGSGVAALYPLVVGKFIEDNPIVLSYTSFFSIVFLVISLSSLSYLTYKDKTRY